MAKTASSVENFDEDLFETRLEALKDTQEGIQQMSTWCLQQRVHHKKIVACWLNVFKRVRVEHRLVLFYLANDVIQYSKRKRYEYVEGWATALQRATTMVRDEKVKGKILRIFNIWEQREIYNEEYLSDLSGLLNINPPKKTPTTVDASDDFQNSILATNVRECVQLSEATDKSFKKLPKAPNCDIENIKQQLKDKSHSEDVEKEIERYVAYITTFNKNLYTEMKCRKVVIEQLEKAMKFYSNQRGEVKVVVSAYKNFGSRIKLVKKKLDEIIPNLPSPMPSPDINAPSPERDADLQLPDDQSPISINIFANSINGYSSYLDGNLPFDINDFKRESNSKISSQPIEVISSRSDEENYGVDYYKPESINSYSNNSSISIPGLNPMPVPPVQSEYSSLARSAQQYNSLLPPPAPPPHYVGNNHGSNEYTPHNLNSYNRDSYQTVNTAPSGIMPPPPMPPTALSGSGVSSTQAANTDDFNSTWDMSMSWTQLDNSLNASTSSTSSYNQTASTPHSPPHFEREAHSGGTAPIEYSEHHNSDLMAAQDVDHRQLHLPPVFNAGFKLALSKDKSRQLIDVDHRNLISLTGSPGINENDKKSSLPNDKDFALNKTGDVDYRAGISQSLKAIDTVTKNVDSYTSSTARPNLNYTKNAISPQKSNASSSSESNKDDSSSLSRYEPTDMVVDMDMSDEDLDEILREVNESDLHLDDSQEHIDSVNPTSAGDGDDVASTEQQDDETTPPSRPALLETPTDGYDDAQSIWDAQSTGYIENTEMGIQHPAWNQMPPMPWNGNSGVAPPPPRPPFLQFQQYAGSGVAPENGRGRGRGRGWSPHNQYRHTFPRPPRGGPGGVPYFSRGGAGPGGNGGAGRGGFRGGRFRGKNSWI